MSVIKYKIHLICRFLNEQLDKDEVDVSIFQESENNVLMVDDDVNDEEQKLLESLIDGKKKEDPGSPKLKKQKILSELNEIVGTITSHEQLEAFKKLMAPARPTLAVIANQTVFFSSKFYSLNIYLKAMGLDKKDEETKVAILLNDAGEEAQKKFRTFDIDEAQNKDL
ncbi:unnamed protein product [Psylliodes chrysocephalus]|uniref:Uncharacterized protein n=1 Tax=Psylliodes chrysocephalus TaxID=3402493 RepID=A0A9P0GEY3_9CUCU|nr:unnamed protein product [Psylliodes chrysocephala]